MIPQHKLLKFYCLLHPQKNLEINPFLYSLCKSLCTNTSKSPTTSAATEALDIVESPELPSWLSFFDTRNPEEDFVIPSLASWVETHKPTYQNRVSTTNAAEKPVSDIDKISRILKIHYPSPEKVVEALNRCSVIVSNDLVEHILRRLSNDWIPAYGAFIWAKTQTGYMHTPVTYNMMVDILGKSKKFTLMWELVNEMDGLNNGYVTLGTMSKVMRRLARSGKYEDAIEVFRGLEKYGLKKDEMGLNFLLDALVKENSVEHSYKVFLEFEDSIPLNSHTFNILIHGWCKARKLEEARKTMDEMMKHNFNPDIVSYTCFVEHYCREKEFRKVDEILKEMKAKGSQPNVVTYTIIMNAFGKAKQLNDALAVYAKMKENGCLPDSSFYSSLIYTLGKAGRVKDADEIFEDMKKQGVKPDVVTYKSMIASACEHSREEAALKLLKKMEEDSCKPDLKTYAPLLKMCCRKKRMKVLSFLLSHMFTNDLSIEVGTYALLVKGLSKSGKIEQALLFFEEMISKDMVPKDSTYKVLVEGLEKKSLTNEKEHVEKLMSKAKKQDGVVC